MVQHVGVFVHDDLVAHSSEGPQAQLVAHGPRGNEKGSLLPQHPGHGLLQQVDGGILAVYVVSHRRGGHGPAHGLTRLGDRVATQIDRLAGTRHASFQPPSLDSK